MTKTTNLAVVRTQRNAFRLKIQALDLAIANALSTAIHYLEKGDETQWLNSMEQQEALFVAREHAERSYDRLGQLERDVYRQEVKALLQHNVAAIQAQYSDAAPASQSEMLAE